VILLGDVNWYIIGFYNFDNVVVVFENCFGMVVQSDSQKILLTIKEYLNSNLSEVTLVFFCEDLR